MHLSLTAGAIRSLELAAQLSQESAATEAQAGHILWALVLQETRAGAILAHCGLTAETLSPLFAPPPGGFDPNLIAAVSEAHIDPTLGLSLHIERQPLVRDLLRQIRDQLTLSLEDNEIGTEHLLYGLLATEPTLAIELRRYGLTLEFLSQKLAGLAPLPFEVDGDITLHYREGHEVENHDTLRILDAAANRAREGLRVLEDYVRFILDDAHLSSRLKNWRHQLSHALRSIAPHQMLAARETEQDVGTQIRTLTEAKRESVSAVVQANFKRVEEAARTLEEFSKILSSDLGQQIGQLRYEIYTLEKAVLQTHYSRQRLTGRELYMLVSEDLCHHGSGPAVRGALQGGVGIVQLREKQLPDRELVAQGRRIREWTREAGALFIMNDRPDLAVLTEADGVHVGQEELSVKDARRIVGPDKLVGVSTHTIEQARQAVLDGADYIGMGPVFATSTKQFTQYAGLDFVRQVAAEIRLPAYAIGGINLENIDQVVAAGAQCVAISSAICGAAQPQDVAQQFRDRIPRSLTL
ncbi:MAG: thiamine phosphate synthase [Planctomycetota bacterium]